MGKDKLKRFSEIKTFENVIQPKLDYNSVDYLLKGNWSDVFKNKSTYKYMKKTIVDVQCLIACVF